MDEVMMEIYPEELKLTSDDACLTKSLLGFGFGNSKWPHSF
jgi:hypothetical protein